MNETDMLTITGAMLALGAAIKHLLPVENKWIPVILLVLGTLVYCVYTGQWGGRDIILGVMASASATGLHQAFSQTKTGLTPNGSDTKPPTQ
jgi:hypothetical protein